MESLILMFRSGGGVQEDAIMTVGVLVDGETTPTSCPPPLTFDPVQLLVINSLAIWKRLNLIYCIPYKTMLSTR